MDFIELSKTRESVRDFTGEAISHSDLLKILEAGRLAPSGCNLQPWHMYVVEQGERLNQLKSAIQFYGTNLFTQNMGAAIVVLGNKPEYPERVQKSLCNRTFYDIDAGILIANMELCATTIGIGTCTIGCFNEEAAKKAIDLDGDERSIKCIVALGVPNYKNPRTKTRKSFDEVITFVKD